MPLPKGKTAIIGLGKAKHTHNLHILSVLRQSSAVLDLCCTWCASFQDVCLGTCPSLPFYADRLHWKHIIHILKVSGWRQQKRKQASNTTLCSSAWVMRYSHCFCSFTGLFLPNSLLWFLPVLLPSHYNEISALCQHFRLYVLIPQGYIIWQ